MFLNEVFDQLTFGELFHLQLGGGEDFGVDPEYYPNLVTNLNLALTALHTRFNLLSDEVIIQQYDHIQEYILNSKYAESNTESTETYKYIKDSSYHPFKDNLLKIEQVFNEDGQEVRLNDSSDSYSVFTPSFNTLQIPYPLADNSLAVLYRATHPKIVLDGNFNPRTIEIDIIPSLVEPLLFYMAHRFLAVNGLQGAGQDSISYLNKYQQSCQRIELAGMVPINNSTNMNLIRSGWR